jgi:hypothetical protein
MRKIFGPFNKKISKIDLDFMRIFSGPFDCIISRSDCSINFHIFNPEIDTAS